MDERIIEVENRLLEIIDSLSIPVDSEENLYSLDDKLNIIISESSQALTFITTIEEEFDIELDDDDIDLDFFLNLDIMKQRVLNGLVAKLSNT